METFITCIKDLGFPIFVALFVLIRLEPAIKQLERSITALAVVAAKSNGMKTSDISQIVDAITKSKQRRRLGDRLANAGTSQKDNGKVQ